MSEIQLDTIVFPQFKKAIDCLGWIIAPKLQTLESECHYFIKFQMSNLDLIYRYAKYSKKQVLNQVIAHDLAGELTPQIYYSDERSLIEEYISGYELTLDCDDEVLDRVATLMDQLHEVKIQGFGTLDDFANPKSKDWQEYNNSLHENIAIIQDLKVLSSNEMKHLESYMMNPPEPSEQVTRLCHGDLCLRNLLYSPKVKKVKLIDWEQVAANYREFDFVLLASYQDQRSKDIYDKIKKRYSHDLNEELIEYFKVRRVVSKYKSFKDDKALLNVMNARLNKYKRFFI